MILANLQNIDAGEAAAKLLSDRREGAELILIAEKEQFMHLPEDLSGVKDIWMMPMSDAEIKFRILRGQQEFKRDRDHWQTSQYLETAINSVPNLVWFKDKNGIHEKVNDSFCRTVNKTKKQVEGRGHAYIWDVEHDDPACIESERIVMTSQKTCEIGRAHV